jgi:hypothetical protein
MNVRHAKLPRDRPLSTPLDVLIERADLRCTQCGAARGQCACWEQCSCGWWTGARCAVPQSQNSRVHHQGQVQHVQPPDRAPRTPVGA